MIRIPPKLAELFDRVPEGVELGDLIFTKGGMKPDGVTQIKPSLTVHISEDLVENYSSSAAAASSSSSSSSTTQQQQQPGAPRKGIDPSTLPLHYSVQALTKKIPVMHPFVRHSQTGSCQLLGTVSRTGNLQVFQQDSHYRAQLKDRIVSTNIIGQRYVKPVDVTESILTKQRTVTAATSIPGLTSTNTPSGDGSSSSHNHNSKNSFGAAVLQFGKQQQEYQEMAAANAAASSSYGSGLTGPAAKKKARQFAPHQPLRSVLFELFEQQPYWTIKELRTAAVQGGCDAAAAKRGEAEIREILRSEIGEYHRSGDNKNKWELRKEFQQQNK
jgi:transcription initiation factor TFIIF subunit beta